MDILYFTQTIILFVTCVIVYYYTTETQKLRIETQSQGKDNREEYNRQRKDIQLERFENKFYELIRLHKENINEMEMGLEGIGSKFTGRRCFVRMFREFKFLFYKTKETYKNELQQLKFYDNDEELCKYVYIVFFFGVGGRESKRYIEYLTKNTGKEIIQLVVEQAKSTQVSFTNFQKRKTKKVFTNKAMDESGINIYTLETECYPYGGHSIRLGHYYRHLFQTVNFVVEQQFLGIDQKRSYLKTLRGQLSNHEQLLLYYNSLSVLGNEWIKRDFLTEYRMIHNIPLPIADFGIKPEVKFIKHIERLEKYGQKLFEWQEIINSRF